MRAKAYPVVNWCEALDRVYAHVNIGVMSSQDHYSILNTHKDGVPLVGEGDYHIQLANALTLLQQKHKWVFQGMLTSHLMLFMRKGHSAKDT